MVQKLTIKISDTVTVELESPDIKQVIERAAFWSDLPKACPLCQAPVVFFHRNPQNYNYYGLRCGGVKTHETNFGQYMGEGKGFFYKGKDSWTESIVKWDTDAPTEERNPPARPTPTSSSLDDIPF